MSKRIYGLKPIVYKDSNVLILGSFPGAESLKQQFYYANNGNIFWDFFSQYSGQDRPHSLSEASAILRELNVAVWDVYESVIREDKTEKKTSNDSDIREYTFNDIRTLLRDYPGISRIGVAGGDPYDSFVEHFPELQAECLPSTSGSNRKQWGGKILDRTRKGWIKWSEFIEV